MDHQLIFNCFLEDEFKGGNTIIEAVVKLCCSYAIHELVIPSKKAMCYVGRNHTKGEELWKFSATEQYPQKNAMVAKHKFVLTVLAAQDTGSVKDTKTKIWLSNCLALLYKGSGNNVRNIFLAIIA